MAGVPPGWSLNVRPAVNDTVRFKQETDPIRGTDWPYGCRLCGRSTTRDGVEICEIMQGVVHSDCHDATCRECTHLVCTDDRCDGRYDCDECGWTRCEVHSELACACM